MSAEHLHTVKELPGVVYALPYVNLDSTWGYVLVEKEEGTSGEDKVVGYILGTSDIRRFEAEAEEKWWPHARSTYPIPPKEDQQAFTDADIYYFNLIAKPNITGQEVVDVYPATIHIDILPEHQRKGWGKRLIQMAAKKVIADGAKGLWVGIDSRNDEGRKFYLKLGFEAIPSKEGEYFALDAEKFMNGSESL